jgi:purine-binding chemotaxis protein CheW
MSGATGGPAAGKRLQLVTFRVGDDHFATDILSVERVLRFAVPRPIPNVPAWLEGVIDYRGRMVPVIDLRTRFELPVAPSRDASRILVFAAGGDWVGAIVDEVRDVATIGADQIEEPPPLFKGLARQYLRGLVRPTSDGVPVLVVLDVAELLTARERIVLEQAVSGAATNV